MSEPSTKARRGTKPAGGGPDNRAAERGSKVRRLIAAPTEVDFLLELERQTLDLYVAAAKKESYVAAQHLLRDARDIRARRDAALKAAKEEGDVPTTEGELMDRLLASARDLPTPYLEPLVAEYLRRMPGARVVFDG